MKVALIVAMDEERGIGRNNDLMWNLPDDMKFFKSTTAGHIVVMGRKNYESIPEKYRPLPNRENVVLSRNDHFQAEDCLVFHRLEDCFSHYSEETERTVFIIGGGEIYRLALDSGKVKEMYITRVHDRFQADTFFPEFNLQEWKEEMIQTHPQDDRHQSGFTIYKYSIK